MGAQALIDLLYDAGLEVREDYSGRGMYGKTCVGFVVENGAELRTVAELVGNEEDEYTRAELVILFRQARTDSMGRDSTIVYFPRVRLEDVPVAQEA